MNSIENRRLRLWNRLLSTTALAALAAVAAILGSTGQRVEGFPALHDPIILIVIVLLAGPVLALAGFMSSTGRIRGRLDHLRRSGLPGTAMFKAVTMPTRMTGGGPVMEVEVEISVPGVTPYRKVIMMPPALAGRMAMDPLGRFAVLVDPGDPMNVLLTAPEELLAPGYSDPRASFGSRERTTDRPSERRTAAPVSLSPSCC